MLTFRRHHRPAAAEPAGAPAPWEGTHAAPEDRALGLELELIELVHRRTTVARDSEAARQLDGEIDQVLDEIAAVADRVVAA